jgi:hypothetical protein
VADGCVGTAGIFSGRPDPEWPLSDRQVAMLSRVWAQLPPGQSAPPRAPALGYRGCAVRCASGEEWFAYGGLVTLTHTGVVVQRRDDSRRRFEKTLLGTAPKGVVPEIGVSRDAGRVRRPVRR